MMTPPPIVVKQDSKEPPVLSRSTAQHSRESMAHELVPDSLNSVERLLDERIRTSCLVIIASAIILAAMEYLKEILRPFFVALTFRYLLTPIIEFLSCQSRTSRKLFGSSTSPSSRCPFRLPRPIAIVLAFFLAFWVLLFLGALIARSVSLFGKNADTYGARVNQVINNLYESWRTAQGGESSSAESDAAEFFEALSNSLTKGLKELNIPGLIGKLLGSAAKVAEDVVYVLLFLVFMLASETGGVVGARDGEDDEIDEESVSQQSSLVERIDEQIFTYIRGKAIIAALVACNASAVYFFVGLDLWLGKHLLASCNGTLAPCYAACHVVPT